MKLLDVMPEWFDRRLGYVGWRTFGLTELEICIGRCVLMRKSAHTASKYRWFADQCVERAQLAAEEAVGYLQRGLRLAPPCRQPQ
jgi:hypothetical protein